MQKTSGEEKKNESDSSYKMISTHINSKQTSKHRKKTIKSKQREAKQFKLIYQTVTEHKITGNNNSWWMQSWWILHLWKMATNTKWKRLAKTNMEIGNWVEMWGEQRHSTKIFMDTVSKCKVLPIFHPHRSRKKVYVRRNFNNGIECMQTGVHSGGQVENICPSKSMYLTDLRYEEKSTILFNCWGYFVRISDILTFCSWEPS